MRACLIAAVLVFFGIGTARAAVDSDIANYILPGCINFIQKNNTPDMFGQGACVGKVMGVAWASSSVCSPVGVTNEEAALVVIAYIQVHPERMRESFMKLAHQALKAAWPCPR